MWKFWLVVLLVLGGCSGSWGLPDNEEESSIVVVEGDIKEELVLSKSTDYGISALPNQEGLRLIDTPEDALVDKTWISPGKVWVAGIYPGARAEYPIRIHNGGTEEAKFSVTYRRTSSTLDGYVQAPEGAQDWVKAASVLPTLGPRETKEVLIVLEIPGDIEVQEDKWEFWIVVKDTSQKGMVMTELALRWLVAMR